MEGIGYARPGDDGPAPGQVRERAEPVLLANVNQCARFHSGLEKSDEPESTVSRREVCCDGIRIAGGGGSYEMVSPPAPPDGTAVP